MTFQVPTKTECYQMMCEMEMMDHIVAHSMQVCRVATYLTDHLIGRHTHLNAGLIRSAALLHDITKTRSFVTGEDHAATGGQFLTDRGYPEVGDLVRQHVVLDIYGATKTPVDADILNYADKRVLHDDIVDHHVIVAILYSRAAAHAVGIGVVYQDQSVIQYAQVAASNIGAYSAGFIHAIQAFGFIICM